MNLITSIADTSTGLNTDGTMSMRTSSPDSLAFKVPGHLEAAQPPEVRGSGRDDVRLMVSHYCSDKIEHHHFREIDAVLAAGDVLVINTSATLNAAVNAHTNDGSPLELHFSTRLPDGLWVVELRLPVGNSTEPFSDLNPGDRFTLENRGFVELLSPYRNENIGSRPSGTHRLWIARYELDIPLFEYLRRYGFPIRYKYIKNPWPIEFYQTVYANETGRTEMPSAGRAFTHQLITRLVSKGVMVLPLILHTGVSSLESHKPPYEEYYRIPSSTARMLNATKSFRKRLIAVGTTTIRALETASDENGLTNAGKGWTNLRITPDTKLKVVDGLLTGFHEGESTHLDMLQALAGLEHVKMTYHEALAEGYLWHEFGDLHLIIP